MSPFNFVLHQISYYSQRSVCFHLVVALDRVICFLLLSAYTFFHIKNNRLQACKCWTSLEKYVTDLCL